MDATPITTDTITLGQFLKLVDIVEQGSQVKQLLAEERVLVNDTVEVRRGRKLTRGDVVVVDDHTFAVG